MSYSFATVAPDRHFGTAVMEHTLVTSPLRGEVRAVEALLCAFFHPLPCSLQATIFVSLTNDPNEQCSPTTCPQCSGTRARSTVHFANFLGILNTVSPSLL